MSLVSQQRIEMSGSAAKFARGRETFFLVLRGETAPDPEQFADGDVFAVAESVDPEPGTWWCGGPAPSAHSASPACARI